MVSFGICKYWFFPKSVLFNSSSNYAFKRISYVALTLVVYNKICAIFLSIFFVNFIIVYLQPRILTMVVAYPFHHHTQYLNVRRGRRCLNATVGHLLHVDQQRQQHPLWYHQPLLLGQQPLTQTGKPQNQQFGREMQQCSIIS